MLSRVRLVVVVVVVVALLVATLAHARPFDGEEEGGDEEWSDVAENDEDNQIMTQFDEEELAELRGYPDEEADEDEDAQLWNSEESLDDDLEEKDTDGLPAMGIDDPAAEIFTIESLDDESDLTGNGVGKDDEEDTAVEADIEEEEEVDEDEENEDAAVLPQSEDDFLNDPESNDLPL